MAGSLTRRLAVAVVPPALLRRLKRGYYVQMLRAISAEPDAAACRQHVRPGDVVIDIGANVGTYAKFLADYVGPNGQVHAVEPIPETFSYLVNSVDKLGLNNVYCYNVAAYSCSGSGYMTVPTWRDGTQNFYEARISRDGIPVQMSRLDDLFSDLRPSLIKVCAAPSCDLHAYVLYVPLLLEVHMKCDVEMSDLEVIKGAVRLIQRCRPVWLIEISHEEVFDLMRSHGYEAIHGHVRSNWFFCPVKESGEAAGITSPGCLPAM